MIPKTNMTNAKKDFISWATVNNLIPLVTSIILIAVSWANLSATVKSNYDLLSQKLDTVIANQNKIEEMWLKVEARLGTAEINIGKLQASQGIK